MRTRILPFLVMTLSLVPSAIQANDIEPGKENYSATKKSIVVDGNLSDWGGVPVFKDTQFYIPKGSGAAGTLVTFEQCDACGFGGSWTGPADASSAFAIAWDT